MTLTKDYRSRVSARLLFNMRNKTENFALCAGLITCGVITSPTALDCALTIRHIVWCLTTIAMCLYLVRKKRNLSAKNTTLFLVFGIYCLATTISIVKASNVSESFYFILTAWLSLIFRFSYRCHDPSGCLASTQMISLRISSTDA